MGAIGPGSIVQAVRSHPGFAEYVPRARLTECALYRVADWGNCEGYCDDCQSKGLGVVLFGQEGSKTIFGERPGWCLCRVRPWPPEPPSELIEQEQETSREAV